MTYTDPLIKLSFGGTMADGLEIWSCGLTMAWIQEPTNYPVGFQDWQQDFPAYVAAIESFVSNPDSRVPSGVQLTWVKAALIDVDGSYMTAPIESPAVAVGGDSGGYIPQGALVYTLVSLKWKDPGRYNRFYLPTSVPTASTGWRLTEAQADAAAAACGLFINALDTIGNNSSTTPVVASPVGTGTTIIISEVRVGRLIDTQRRRRNAIAEDYSTVPIVAM